jgi:hypothetical protein
LPGKSVQWTGLSAERPEHERSAEKTLEAWYDKDPMPRYASFAEFYPFYLSEHAQRTTRRLHFIGSSLGLVCLMMLILTGNLWWLGAGLVCGYGFAWFAHFTVEKNRPATFRQPLYSLMGDWKMFWQILTGRIAF